MLKRVAITGIGVCSSLGFCEEEILSNLKKPGVLFSASSFDDGVAVCPVHDFNIKDFTGRFKQRRYLNRGSQLCVASAIEAIKSSGIKQDAWSEAGLFIGSGPNLDIGGEFPEVKKGEIDHDDLMALWMLKFLPNTAASAIATYAGIHGENLTINTACAASMQALGEAFRKIKHGYLNLALAGGGDSRLNPGGILAYRKAGAIFSGSKNPDNASRPFDTKRKGFVPGEGGAIFVLEEMEHARMRGASIHAEICGFGSSMDGYSMTAPEPSAQWGEKALLSALHEAGMSPEDIDVVSSHGTGTLLNDAMEVNLLHRIFKDHHPHVIALKSWIGHIAAACGAIELAVVLACIKSNYFPRIRNLDEACHDKINFAREDKKIAGRTVLLENFGFGGQNSAIIIRKVDN